MAKSKEVFICQNCGAASPKWQGQCAGCGEWNTLLAEVAVGKSRANRPGAAQACAVRTPSTSSLAAEAALEQAAAADRLR